MSDAYSLTATLHQGATDALYRGVRRSDGAPVLIKTSNEFERLRNEYEITRRLNSTYLLEPYELDRQDARPRLILEDFDGEPLARVLDHSMAVSRFFGIALQLIDALADVHRQGVVHQDLKPANIRLKADLQRCALEWKAHRRIALFSLGGQDVSSQLLIPKKLYRPDIRWIRCSPPSTASLPTASRRSCSCRGIPASASPR